jgi:hypothetical protein
MLGSTLPFASTPAERNRTNDPRPSIAERYADRDQYLARVRTAAESLAAERYVLAEDVSLLVELAQQRFDAFAAAKENVAAPADGGYLHPRPPLG